MQKDERTYARATDAYTVPLEELPPKFNGNGPRKPKKMLLNRIITIVAILVLLISGTICIKYFKDLYDSKQTAETLVAMTEVSAGETYPAEPAEVLPQYRAAYTENNDLVGWISVPNTAIDFPVVQGDDNDFYLRRDFNKEYLRRGSIYMDYRNHIDTPDKNTILYGHNYLDSTMFSDLENYKDIAFYKTAPVISFNTIYREYKWKVIGVFLTTASPELDNDYVFNYIYPFMTDSSFAEFVQEVEKRSFYHTGVDVLPTDKVLTLSTCSRDLDRSARKQENVRCVVVARMVRDGESETVDVSKAVVNENQKFPQLYYDKYKKSNPFRNDEKWYPRGEG